MLANEVIIYSFLFSFKVFFKFILDNILIPNKVYRKLFTSKGCSRLFCLHIYIYIIDILHTMLFIPSTSNTFHPLHPQQLRRLNRKIIRAIVFPLQLGWHLHHHSMIYSASFDSIKNSKDGSDTHAYRCVLILYPAVRLFYKMFRPCIWHRQGMKKWMFLCNHPFFTQ